MIKGLLHSLGTKLHVVVTLIVLYIHVHMSKLKFNPLQPLQIKSAVAVEGLKGYIYIESYKQQHVKQAIDGIGNLRLGQWTQQMVPIKEMTDVMRVVKDTATLKRDSWVRIKRGMYKDDIAQVTTAWSALEYVLIPIHTCVHVHTCTCSHVHVYVHVHTCVTVHLHLIPTCTNTHTHFHTHMHTHSHTHSLSYTCTHTHLLICIHTCTHSHTLTLTGGLYGHIS